MSRVRRTTSLGVPLEQRCHTAFAEHAGGELLAAGSFDAAFRRAGFPDARTDEVERYHQNFVLQRQGVAGSCLRLDEFVRILAAHDQKRQFLENTSISSKDWVCQALRAASHCFIKSTEYKGACLWSVKNSNRKMMAIIIQGRAMLWGRQGNGQVDFPVCELGTNAVIGDGLMPNMASKVVVMSETDVLYIPMSEVKSRLGDRFLDEMAASLEVKNRHTEARMCNMQRVCKRAICEPALAQLPFLPMKNQMKDQLSQGMQKLATAQSQKRSATMEAKRAKAMRTGGVGDDNSDNHPSLAEQNRTFRLERSGRILGTSKAPALGTRSGTSMLRGKVPQRIPRRIQSSEFHVSIDTGSMMYDDLR